MSGLTIRKMTDSRRTPASGPLVLALDDDRAGDPSLAGGKAANLARLLSLPDIRIPAAFVVTTEAYCRFLNENPDLLRLTTALDGLADEKLLRHHVEKIGRAMKNACIPCEVAASICDFHSRMKAQARPEELRMSVRSSAAAEDSHTASFAGQYDTYLNQSSVADLLESVRKVWASAFGLNPVNYRKARGIRHADTRMAVILQRMVDARSAGTAFTVDIETGTPLIRVHASYGLGEAEVRGSVTPDLWIVDPADLTIIKRALGAKAEKVIYDFAHRKTVSRPTQAEERANFALSCSEVRDLARRVRCIGEYYAGCQDVKYVDVEFAVDREGNIFMLQARPETAWAGGKCSLVAVDIDRAHSLHPLSLGGFTASPGVAVGRLCVAGSLDEAEQKVKPGDILVVANTTNLWERVLGLCAGAITDIGGPGCHTAIVMREQSKASLTGAGSATRALKSHDGQVVTLDATRRTVFLDVVPKEWLVLVNNLRPSYGTLDNETEDESWDEATRTGQTRIGTDGRRWIGKPIHPVGRFMQEVYRACHAYFGDRISAPVRTEIWDSIHWVDFHDLWQWRLHIRSLTLEQLEGMHRERLEAAQAYSDSCNSFTLTPDALLRWLRSFIRMNAFMGAAYNIYKVTEGRLEQELSDRQLQEPYYSQVRPSIGALAGETEATRELRAYGEILDLVRSNQAWLLIAKRASETGDPRRIQQGEPEFYGRLEKHAARYKAVKNTDLVHSLVKSVAQLAARLARDVADRREVSVAEPIPAEFYPEDARFVRIARLTLESEKARQDAHHVNYRGHGPVKNKLRTLAEWLAGRGEVSALPELFDHTPDWLLRQIIRYRISRWLGGFLGIASEVPPLPEDISIETYERLRSLGFDIFYLPPVEVSGAGSFRRYPEWRYPLEERYWAARAGCGSPLTGQWVAIELLKDGQALGEAGNGAKTSGGSGRRPMLVSWDSLQKSILPETARLLGREESSVRLPSALEWNLLGNLLFYCRRTGEEAPEWPMTASRMWTHDRNDLGQHALVGKDGADGVGALEAVEWIGADEKSNSAFQFRALAVL